MAEILGVEPNEVTPEDQDALTTIIAESEVILENRDDRAEIAMYDVNNDGVLDELDQQFMEAAVDSGDYSGFVDSVFNPATGMFLAQQEADEANAELLYEQDQEQQALQAQIDENQARVEAEGREEDARRLFAKGRTRTMSAGKPGDLAMIQYQYDVGGDSIFATPQQGKFYGTPYGNKAGGQIKAKTDEILKIIGNKR